MVATSLGLYKPERMEEAPCGCGAFCVKAAVADGIDGEEFGPENPSFNSGA